MPAPETDSLLSDRLADGGPRYVETPADPYAPGAPYVAEPWNAVTASFFIFIVLAWVWLDLALCVQASSAPDELRQGKLAAARYFFRYELPRVPAWLKVVETRDDTCRSMEEAWF